MYKSFLKRLMDIVISGVAIIVLAIPMLIVTVAIKIDDPGPVLFKQKREKLVDSSYSRYVACKEKECGKGQKQGIVYLSKRLAVGDKYCH